MAEQTIELCYHCHKCTAGCPVGGGHALWAGSNASAHGAAWAEGRLLSSPDIWLCAGCETCGTRCPNEIDIAHVMDALRQMAQVAREYRLASRAR